ncbi:MAG: ribosomal-processing cysteine protease Prp [Lachnospiraceae bacterium]|nr:ribosomal-processing cysteine protease Prp [Lachnospiraceae bacterium]
MIEAILYLNKDDNKYVGFDISGHAKYRRVGKDIVCSAVSILSTTIVNSFEAFTDFDIEGEYDPKGSIKFRITSNLDEKSQLLLVHLLWD